MEVFVRDLQHRYAKREREGERRGRAALEVSALHVRSREKLCLIGSSGSGKTTLLSILAGVLSPSAGRVLVGECDLFARGEAQRDQFRARHIGCVFQTLNLLSSLSVFENLTLAQRFAGVPAGAARRRALELLERLGLSDRAGARPAELSLGEQQRIAVARAISKNPSVVLADEPTASLDDENARATADVLLEACRDSTLIVASHDARLISRFERVRKLSDLAPSEPSARG